MRISTTVSMSRAGRCASLCGCLLSVLAIPAAQAWNPGKDGALSVTTANTVVNTYTTLGAAATQNATTITVTSAAALTGLAVGDVLLIYNPQGATITSSDTAAYGAISALNNAGRFEFVNVDVINGNTLTVDSGGSANTCGGGLRYSYDNGAEVVRVPQYLSLTISGAGSVTAQAWNGTTGGIVAAFVQNTATVGGAGISVAGQGFRGGAVTNNTGTPGTDWAYYRVTFAQQGCVGGCAGGTINGDGGAQKGESIAGNVATYEALYGGGYGRGAPANGGGGGNAHNGGGGGGANGDNGVTWTGEGNPDNSVGTYTTAWNIDGTITSTHTDSGGGRGGYTYAANVNDPTTTAPGAAAWGGNDRRERGGLGGRPLTNNASIAAARLYFGGGGGAGDENNTAGTGGGNGGGIVFLVAGTVAGTGTINANGNAALDNTGLGGGNDAPGGGGAGGSIIVISNNLSGVALTANGGKGGNQHITSNESEGAGGGGGGGYIAVLGGSPASSTATGGVNGTSDSKGVQAPKFAPNGATQGSSGIANAVAPSLSNFPVCNVSALAITKTDNSGGAWVAGQVNAQYALSIKNTGSVPTTGAITVLDSMPAGIMPPASFASGNWNCTFTSPTLTCTDSIDTLAALGGNSAIAVPVTVTSSARPSATNQSSVGGGGDPNNSGNPPVPGSCAVGDNHCGNDTTTINAATAPFITKAFNPMSIRVGGTSTLTLTFQNPVGTASLTGLNVSDTFPPGMSVASTPGATNSCGGAFTPNPGDTTISLSGGALAPSAICTISVDVTASAAGALTNITGNVSTNESGAGGQGAATLTLIGPPSLAKVFNPASIARNGTTSLTFTVTNPNTSTTLTGVGFSDTLPTGLTIANSTTTVCGGTLTTTSPTGITLSGATVAASGTCQFSATVTGATAGSYINTTGAVTSNEGGTGNVATAPLTVSAPPSVTKAFGGPTVALNGSTSLTFTITNPNTTSLSGIAFTDTLPSGLTVASAPGLSNTCNGTATAVANSGSVSLSGGTLAGSGTCTLSVSVTGTTTGAKNNSVTVSSTEGGTGNTSTASITVVAPPTIAKSFTPNTILVNGTTQLSLTITNPNTTQSLSGIGFTDTFPLGMAVVSPVSGTGNTCGGTFSPTANANNISLSGGTIAANGSCTITVNVTDSTAGTATNTTGAVSSTEGGNGSTATATLTVTAPQLSVSKTANGPWTIGQSAPQPAYTITVSNAAAATAASSGNITITDNLPTGITLSSASGANWSCTGTTALTCTFTGTIAIGSSTTLTLNVTVGATAVNGNNTATMTGGDDPTCPSGANCTSTVNVSVIAPSLGVTKTANGPWTVAQSSPPPSYTLTVTNSGTAATSGTITMDDKLPNGITAAASFSSGSWNCTTVGQSVACTSSAVLAATNGTSTITVPVTVGAAAVGNVTNNASVGGGGDPNNGGNPPTPGTCAGGDPHCGSVSTTVNAPSLGVTKTSNGPWTVAQSSPQPAYTLTVTNTGAVATSGTITVDDALPNGITAAASFSSGSWNCTTVGQSVACTSSAVLAATNGSSTITIPVTVGDAAVGNVTNNASVGGGGDPNNGGTPPVPGSCAGGDPHCGSTGTAVNAPKLTVNKTANGAWTIGQSSPQPAYTITVNNSNTATAASSGNITITDNLPTGITLSSASGANWSCTGTTALSCTFTGTIAIGGSTMLTLNVAVGAAAANGNNTVTMTGGGDPTCPGGANCTSTVTVGVNSPSLGVTKTSNGPWTVGQANASYTLTVTNSGSAATSGMITVDDTLPSGITANWTNPLTSGVWSCTFSGQNVTCTSSTNLAATNGSSQITLPVTVGAAAGGLTVTNNASVGGGGDPNSGGNPPAPGSCTGNDPHCGSASTQVVSPPTVGKMFNPSSILTGGTSTLTITLSNANATPLTGVSMTDTLPSGMTVAAPNTTGDTCGGTATAASGSGSVSLTGGTIPASGTCAVTVTVTSSTNGAAVNIIAIGGVNSTNGGSNTTMGTATLTVDAPTPVTPTPMLDLRSLLLLALGLLSVGAYYERRRIRRDP